MARTHNHFTKALLLYLVLAPSIALRAEAQGAPRPFDPPAPIVPRSGDPQPAPDDVTVFTTTAEPMTLRSFNGFRSDGVPGVYSHHGHGHGGGVALIESPWGEQMTVRYWQSAHGLTFEYDDDLKVRYQFDEAGALEEIVAQTPDTEARMPVGNRAELAYRGQRAFESFDLSAYVLIEQSLSAKHSADFLSGLRQFDGPAEVSCATQGIQCLACIVGWAVSVVAIAEACVVGGVPTFGLACFAAIVAHEATNFACAATCVGWADDCLRQSPHNRQPYPDGCEF